MQGIEIDNGSAQVFIGYKSGAGAETGMWWITNATGGFLAQGTFAITDPRGLWYNFRISKSGTTWQVFYKGILKGSASSSWTGIHEQISLLKYDNNSQFWGRVSYHWTSQNSTYTSQYGTAGFGIATISWFSKTSTMNASEVSGELQAWDSDPTCP